MVHLFCAQRSKLAVWAMIMLVAPFFLVGHHHEAEHDGGAQHVEVAHGGHLADVVELDDQVPSLAPTFPFEATASAVDALYVTITSLPALASYPHRSARAPPRSPRPRSPPVTA